MDIERRISQGADTLDAAIESHLAGRLRRPGRSHWVATVAAATIAFAGVGGLAAMAWRGEASPSQTTTAVMSPAPIDTTSTTIVPPAALAPGVLPVAGDHLRGFVQALMLQHVERDEMVAFLSTNVPEADVATCMAAAGFDYTPEAAPEEQVAGDVRYSMTPEQYAATYGLGITGWELGLIPPIDPPRNQPALSALDEAGRTAFARSEAQCREQFDPDDDRWEWSDAVNVAVDLFRAVIDTDERVLNALATWQSCMAAAGYEFETPMAMRESLYARMNNTDEALTQIFDDEVRIAVANVSCEADYEAVRRDVITERFGEFQAMFDAALASGASPDAQG